jgi:hypothetical protein
VVRTHTPCLLCKPRSSVVYHELTMNNESREKAKTVMEIVISFNQKEIEGVFI